MKGLIRELSDTLSLASEQRPLIVYLDSLDQLDSDSGARQLAWLPKHLPPHTKLVVSTLPEEQYDCFPRLQVRLISYIKGDLSPLM